MVAFLRFYIYSNLHISICAVLFTAGSYYFLNQPIYWIYPVFLGAATFVLYGLHRFVGLVRMKNDILPSRFQYFHLSNGIMLLSVGIAAIVLLISGLKLADAYYLFLAFPIVISALYISPVLPKGKRFRDLPYLKIFLIALVWSYLFIVPLLVDQSFFTSKAIAVGVEKFFFFLAITLPFDIRDIEGDRQQNLPTLVNSLGLKGTKFLIVLCIIGGLCTILYQFTHGFISDRLLLALFIFYLVTMILGISSSPDRSERYFMLYLDGMIGIQGLIYIYFGV